MRRISIGVCTVGLVALAVMTSSAAMQRRQEGELSVPKHAVAVLSATKDSDVGGVLTLKGDNDSVQIRGKVWNLEPGKHGFHIHEFGDLRDPEGKSAGEHFNPTGESHGGPGDAVHHAGDLGNIVADRNGVAHVDMTVSRLTLHVVIGRSIVVHAKPDDLKSQPSGESGGRVAFGVIGVAEGKDE